MGGGNNTTQHNRKGINTAKNTARTTQKLKNKDCGTDPMKKKKSFTYQIENKVVGREISETKIILSESLR